MSIPEAVFTVIIYRKVHTKHPPPPGTFGPTLIRGWGVFKAIRISDKSFGNFSKFSSNMRDIFFSEGGCLKRYGAKISDFGLN